MEEVERRFSKAREGLEARCAAFEAEARRLMQQTTTNAQPPSPPQGGKSSEALAFGMEVAGKMDVNIVKAKASCRRPQAIEQIYKICQHVNVQKLVNV